jgi:hypothetical protein
MLKNAAAFAMIILVHALFPEFVPGGKNLIRNGDFEKFNGNDPIYWQTSNIPKVLTVVSPSEKSHTGKYAVKIEVKDWGGSKMAGMICQKDLPVDGASLDLALHYQVRSVGRDAGYIAFDFHSADESSVGMVEEYLTDTKGDFIQFKKSVDVPANATHLDLKCSILPGEGSDKLHEGSYMLIDHMELLAGATAPKE